MQDMVGKRFGKLEIVEYEKRKPNALSRCTCKCDCGNTIEIGLCNRAKKLRKKCAKIVVHTKERKSPKDILEKYGECHQLIFRTQNENNPLF